MNRHQQRRGLVIAAMDRGECSVGEGATVLGVSVRHARRLLAIDRQRGVAALAHGNRGRVPTNAVDEETRHAVVMLATERDKGFNQVHLTQQLGDVEGITLSRSSVRRILAAAGIRSPRTRRAAKHRSRRLRYPRARMLGQIDASPHDWLEGRGPRLTLFAAIDDATGEPLALLFRAEEDAHGYFLLVRQVVARDGRPLAFYHDQHSIFLVNAKREGTVAEALAGERAPTEFGRLRDELGITSIPARSPQANGRVERLFNTLQDRLVSMLRLAGAANEAEATACLVDFLMDYNDRFTGAAAEEGDCYRALEAGIDPDTLFCFNYQRTVGMDNTVRFAGARGQLLPGARRRSWARAVVEVQERLDGALAVYYQGACLTTTPAPPEAPLLRARGGRRGVAPQPVRRRERVTATSGGVKPGTHHPWQRGYHQRQDRIAGQQQEKMTAPDCPAKLIGRRNAIPGSG